MGEFSGALHKAIEGSGLTIYRIAKDSGLDFSAVSRFYHGERDLTLTSADKLADFFELEVKKKAKPKRKK